MAPHRAPSALTGRGAPLFAPLTWALVLVMSLFLGCNRAEEEPAEQQSCVRGAQGCSCEDGILCGLADNGQQMACMAGICDLAPCQPGEVGCVCDQGSCDAGLECSSSSGIERCEVTGCAIGDTGCGCALDRSCTGGSTCVSGICETPSCAVGSLECTCTKPYTCNSGLVCDAAQDICRTPGSCTPGNTGCECLADASCVGDLVCTGGVCQAPNCPAGRLGCACLDGACGADTHGDPLECVAGVCEEAACATGQTGCACKLGASCDTPTDTCVDGFCRPGSCIAGTENCECLAGGCDVGLTCRNGAICIDETGQRGGPCKADGTCNRNNKCDTSLADATCTFCDLGTKGCQCKDDSSCTPGLMCQQGHCVGDETVFNREVPANKVCYTPCERNLTKDDGTIRFCEKGLIQGCLDGQRCDEGSCVAAEGGAADICFEDSDCADFQLCIKGYCYAECQRNEDCADEMSCHNKVCRKACSLTESTCPRTQICQTIDGQNGFCFTKGSDQMATATPPPASGKAYVDRKVIEFTNISVSTVLTLQNDTDQYVNFTLRKVEHNALLQDKSQDEVRDYDPASMCSGASCPLWWVEMGEFGSISPAREVTVRAEPRCGEDCPKVTVRIANGGQAIDAVRWRGVVQVDSDVSSQRIDLSYVSSPEGRWSGKMYYFANFETQGIDTVGAITGWLDRADLDNVRGVQNGLIQRWGAFRNGDLTGGWDEMKAVLRATETGQWRNGSVQDDCIVPNGACYLYNTALPKVYVTELDAAPIPTGVAEFPMAMSIHVPQVNTPAEMRGRIVSNAALHYAGDPSVALTFDADPADTAHCDPDVRTNCVNFIDSLEIDLKVGGRYPLDPDALGGCDAGFEQVSYPWLVPGFLEDVVADPQTGAFTRRACLDARLPYFGATDPDHITANRNLARSNPIPNGRVLSRHVELLDGAMIDQSEIIVLFRERYPSFLDADEESSAYGYMIMTRQPTQIEEADANGDGTPDEFEGSTPPATIADAGVFTGVQCSEDLLRQILGPTTQLTAQNAPWVIQGLIKGGSPNTLVTLDAAGAEHVHYVCEDTGLFDGGPEHVAGWMTGNVGPNDDSCVTSGNGVCEDGLTPNASASSCAAGTDLTDCGGRYTDRRLACPRTSRVVFFTLNRFQAPNLAAEPCQQDGTCMDRLREWNTTNARFLMQVDPIWACADGSAFCDENTLDRRSGKTFYPASEDEAYFLPLRAEIDEAFRYKTQFISRAGKNVGFVPEICEELSSSTPYCYDAAQIEQLDERVDCLLDIYDQYYTSGINGDLTASNLIQTYLKENFATLTSSSSQGGLGLSKDGYERLRAELLIMLGDDAFTAAFESRFDLAGGLAASFEGSLFEDGGIDLSGVAGYEMFKLYQAVQYYDMVLDRFYRLGEVMGEAIKARRVSSERSFITPDTVVSYFDRVVRASTQRSRAMAEIARRYQNFNRPDLAKRVAQRAYTATYLESVVLASLMNEIYVLAGGSNRPQIRAELEKSQLRYRMALLDLVNVYETISQDINYFGYAPDFIPFPALDQNATLSAESNAFEKVQRTALAKLDIARTREQAALQQTRSYNTDEASFQAELARISQTYKAQLGDLCGVFTADDGIVYPAIERFAYLEERLAVIGDPCGFAGNGQLHNAIVEMELREIELRQIGTQIQNVFERVSIEQRRVEDQCGVVTDLADYQFKVGARVKNLAEENLRAQENVERVMRIAEATSRIAEAAKCELTGCAAAAIAVSTIVTMTATTEVAIGLAQKRARERRADRDQFELDSAKWTTLKQCDIAQIDSDARVAELVLSLKDLELSLLAAEYKTLTTLAEIGRLRQQSKRLELEWQENQGLAINVEAAKNDPNVRIYRNDAVINAEISFEDALREAYRLTRVYEYYTSQSYAARDKLFLTRMVSYGDINLENYVYELSNAFVAFEEEFGSPEKRLQIVSLRDDILQIPRSDRDAEALNTDARVRILREYLRDPSLLNAQGYLTIPFRTQFEELSPLTRNHKVLYLEAGIEGNDNGDFLGRVYVRQVGTSVINSVEGQTQYYRFPERTAVINPFFNNAYQFKDNPDLYRSFRMRDRPMVNTAWELVINQRDEQVNQDINLDELTDIKLYIYYTDFTVY